ncbi:MAG: Holliday junction resolvase RuvX [Acidobacteriota bacterium]|nr:Holliday junction resolvase RuvX [Acidobacteriota bacterium]
MSSLSAAHERILALDLGTKRIGLAVSDELGITAQGLETLSRTNKRADFAALSAIAAEKQIRLIVLGNPLRMNGEAGRQARWALEFADDLRRHTGIEVRLWDERLTSVEATRVLQGSGIANDKRKAAIDRLSAVILLQSYLDSLGVRPL